MRVAKGLVVVAVAAAIGVVSLWQFGCDKHPTKPDPSEPKDYPVYFCNQVNSTLWIFHPLTRKLDSMVVPFEGEMRSVTVSADGRLLYFFQMERVLVLTADSLRLVAELPYGGQVAISPDNYLLAIMGSDFNILRTTDWTVVYADTTGLYEGVFTKDSRTFYASESDSSWLFWVTTLDSTPTTHHKKFPTPVTHMIPTPDSNKLLLCLLWHFLSYDIARDSVLFDITVWPGLGYLGMTPDGRYGFFGNPSTPFGELGTTDLYVFDVRANRICDTMHIDHILDSLQVWAAGVGEMVVTPDNRWLVAIDAPLGPHVLILYDLFKREAVYLHDFGANHWFGNITVQQMR